jgi:uncharacterized protein (TIGR03546 family)
VIKAIVKLVVTLNSRQGIGEIAGGAAFGLLLALVPAGNLLWAVLLLLTWFLKVNFAVEMLVVAVLKLVLPLVDPLLDSLGYVVLTLPPLQGPFTALYNAPIAPLLRFNNTIVMGGLLTGIALWAPAWLLLKRLVILYREKAKPRIEASKAYKWLRKLPLIESLLKAAARSSGLGSGG